MTAMTRFDAAFAELPLVAILRGVKPDEVEALGEALFAAGFRLIEVPLNSPDPIDSIARLAKRLGDRALVGAGTVLKASDVTEVQGAGGTLIVAPNFEASVVRAAADAGLIAIPGIATPSEAFAALAAGAAALKLFPAEASSPAVLKAMRAVFPKATRFLPVGGINVDTMAPWQAAGAAGFGLGSALYAPGMGTDDVAGRASRFVTAARSLGLGGAA